MYSLVFLVAIVASFSSSVFGLPDECKLPLDMGKTPCKTGKKEIRYHFDVKAYMPLRFEYTGCGGNKNNFKTEFDCRNQCVGYSNGGCPGGTEPFKNPATCQNDKDCGPKGYCKYGDHFSVCCDKATSDKITADFTPKCPKGKKVYKVDDGGIPTAPIGKTCKSNFCPKGAACVEGNFFAICCN